MKQKKLHSHCTQTMHVFCISPLIRTLLIKHILQFPFPRIHLCKQVYRFVHVYRNVVVDMHQGKRRESALTHAGSHVCVQSSQSTCTSLAFTRSDRNGACKLQKHIQIWKRVLFTHLIKTNHGRGGGVSGQPENPPGYATDSRNIGSDNIGTGEHNYIGTVEHRYRGT